MEKERKSFDFFNNRKEPLSPKQAEPSRSIAEAAYLGDQVGLRCPLLRIYINLCGREQGRSFSLHPAAEHPPVSKHSCITWAFMNTAALLCSLLPLWSCGME